MKHLKLLTELQMRTKYYSVDIWNINWWQTQIGIDSRFKHSTQTAAECIVTRFKSGNFDPEDREHSSRQAVVNDDEIKMLIGNNAHHMKFSLFDAFIFGKEKKKMYEQQKRYIPFMEMVP